MDNRLLEMLVCPQCKGPLEMLRTGTTRELTCHADKLAFPIRDDIPVMLESEARRHDPFADPYPNPLTDAKVDPGADPQGHPPADPDSATK